MKADYQDGVNGETSDALPPSYNANVPDISAAFSNLYLRNDSTFVSKDECIAHLKLLDTFYQLREEIGNHDGLYGIQDDFVPSTLAEKERTELLFKMREKRWVIFTTNAVLRFEIFWKKCIQPGVTMISQQTFASNKVYNEDVREWGRPLRFTTNDLPPLDVLMVWHAYMLNPRSFFADCIRYGKVDFWVTGLPWDVVDSVIDIETLEYKPGENCQRTFENKTGLSWGSLHGQSRMQLPCPRCQRSASCEWTSYKSKDFWQPGSTSSGTGYTDKDFCIQCTSCQLEINHELLRAQKFRKDLQLLMLNDVPLPGTFLTIDGLPEKHAKLGGFKLRQALFPNQLIQAGLSAKMLEVTDAKIHNACSMSDVRTLIEAGLKDRTIMKAARGGKFLAPLRDERIAIRRMMASYWENSSPFALDLVGAVIRQSSFIEKMHSIDWIHSPALSATIPRLVTKYERFFQIMAQHPGQVAVPTLDVDLAWHTHQLSPSSYLRYSVTETRVFIDHDDKIEESKLSDSFEWTSKTYQKMFNSVYSECTCWYCEAVRESHTSTVSRLFKSNNDPIANELDHLRSLPNSSNPHKTAHISAHSAIQPIDSKAAAKARSAVKSAELDRNYRKACQRARKKGRSPPSRDDYMYAYAWGYPMYMPFYAPYMIYPCTPDLYYANPACANMTVGGAGNCAAGTCGGVVAAGGCAGTAAGGSCGGAVAASQGGCGGGGGGCGGGG